MTYYIQSAVFVPDPAGWRHFTRSPAGVVGSDLRKRGRRLVVLAKATVGKETGALARSIEMTYFPASNPYVMVGSNLRYAYYVHEGTKPHTIDADNGRVLRFKVAGKIVYARDVKHPGTKPTRYLARHLRKVVND